MIEVVKKQNNMPSRRGRRAMHAVIAVPQLHGSANIHIHFASHGAARDAKAWFDNRHRFTKHLRHAPASRLACKFSNYAPATCPQELRIPHHSMWSHPVVLASWDPQVIHLYPCPPPPCPIEQRPTAWNEWYLDWSRPPQGQSACRERTRPGGQTRQLEEADLRAGLAVRHPHVKPPHQ